MKMDLLILYRLLHTFLLTDALALTILSFDGDIRPEQLGRSLILLVPAVLLYLAVKRFKGILPFLLLAVLSGGILYGAAGSYWERSGWCVGFLVLLAGYFMERAGSGQGIFARPYYASLLVFGGVYVYALAYHREFLGQILCAETGFYWVLCILDGNRRSLLGLYEENMGLHRFPKSRIAWGNRIALGSVCALLTAGMIFLPMSGADRFLRKLGNILLAVLRWLFSFLVSEEEVPLPEPEMAESMPFFPMDAKGGTSVFWETFFAIMERVMFAVILAALAVIICRVAYQIYKKYTRTRIEDGDRVEFLNPAGSDEKQKLKGERRRGLFSSRSPQEIIRRYYKKKIHNMTEGKPGVCSTPSELEEAAKLPQGETREVFHNLYEKARYGKEPCSPSEVRQMKEMLK